MCRLDEEWISALEFTMCIMCVWVERVLHTL